MLVVGISDPRESRLGSRGNVGAMVLDSMVDKFSHQGGIHIRGKMRNSSIVDDPIIQMYMCNLGTRQVTIIKPMVAPEDMGAAVLEYIKKSNGTRGDIIVVHDDIDYPCGKFRIKSDVGDGGHPAVRSITEVLGEKQEFVRVRLGVGRVAKGKSRNDFLASPFDQNEYDSVLRMVDSASDAIQVIVSEGMGSAKKRFHSGNTSSSEVVDAKFDSESKSLQVIPNDKPKLKVTQTGGPSLQGVSQSKQVEKKNTNSSSPDSSPRMKNSDYLAAMNEYYEGVRDYPPMPEYAIRTRGRGSEDAGLGGADHWAHFFPGL